MDYSINGLKTTDFPLEKEVKLYHSFTAYANLNSRWIEDLSVMMTPLKILGEKWVMVIEWGEFSKHDIKFRSQENKINSLAYIKLNFFVVKMIINKTKRCIKNLAESINFLEI